MVCKALLFITVKKEIRTLLGTEQPSATVRGAIIAEVSKANWTLLQALLLVADFANTAFHERLSFPSQVEVRGKPEAPIP